METINPVVSLMAGLRLQSQLAVRPKTDEFEDIGAALAVDEYKIGPEVTVAATLPGSSQGVVAVSGIRRLVGGERLYDSAEDGVEGLSVPSSPFSVVIRLN